MKKAIVSVINDLNTDQRVNKTCLLLEELNFEVILVGRNKKDSRPLENRSYKMHRMKLLFEKGPLFYAEYNLRLFFYLITHRADLLFSNDLDTLLPNFLISRFKRIPLVYDSHELFTETPEVIHRPFVQQTWQIIEKIIFPKLKNVITVSPSIARIFEEKYGVSVKVVRNIPQLRNNIPTSTLKDLDLPTEKKILILQGAGINIQRGAEELIEAMTYLEEYLLLIIGGGDVIEQLKELATQLKLTDRIRFIPRLPVEQLIAYTRVCDLGLSLDKDTNLNYRYSLPNKLFDYIHAEIPILASPLPEIKNIIESYDIGLCILGHEPRHIAARVREAFSDNDRLETWKKNLHHAATELNWENEKQILLKLIQPYA